uniref:Uncharacterized protein n=1 Tax=Mus spicilegus TaxID=10103 RepID=A0A8C6H2K1_MUSSI
MRRNITNQAFGETHMPVTASAYSLWGGMRKGFLTDPCLSSITSVSYVTYKVENIPIPTCPLPIVYTWIPLGYNMKRGVAVPNIWSRQVSDFYHQLESLYPDAVAPNAFPCSLKAILPSFL